jgi:RimJ/RimL family protein N-acetyltransferase
VQSGEREESAVKVSVKHPPVEVRRFLPAKPRFLRGPRLPEPVDAREIRTARLRLRPHRMGDFGPWLRMHRQPQTVRYLRWPSDDPGAIRRHLRARTRQTRLWQTDDFLALAIEVDGELAGEVSVHLRSVRAGTRMVEVGWVLDERFTGRGLATEAAEALLEFAFDTVGARLAVAVIDHGNVGSVAVAERLGFRLAGADAHELTYVRFADAPRPELPDRRLAGSRLAEAEHAGRR